MKYILLLILLLTTGQKKEIKVESGVKKEIGTYVPYFPSIYSTIRQYEGNYVFHKDDKGGETYGGVTRKYSPNWYGWRYVGKGTKTNQIIEEAEFWVKDHYLDIWINEGFDQIKDYNVVLALFDFRINSSFRTYNRKVNKVLLNMNQCSINECDPKEFVLRLKIERIILYTNLALNDPTQRTFYKGWIKRLEL